MISEKRYLLDANVFMQASRGYYSFDLARPFWNALVVFARNKKVISIDKVFQEIKEGEDEMKEWAKQDFSEYFDTTETSGIIQRYADLVNWVELQPQYNQPSKDSFMEDHNADAWVLAYALANDCIITTMETQRSNAVATIPIPNVCKAFNIEYCNTFQMLKKLAFSF